MGTLLRCLICRWILWSLKSQILIRRLPQSIRTMVFQQAIPIPAMVVTVVLIRKNASADQLVESLKVTVTVVTLPWSNGQWSHPAYQFLLPPQKVGQLGDIIVESTEPIGKSNVLPEFSGGWHRVSLIQWNYSSLVLTTETWCLKDHRMVFGVASIAQIPSFKISAQVMQIYVACVSQSCGRYVDVLMDTNFIILCMSFQVKSM